MLFGSTTSTGAAADGSQWRLYRAADGLSESLSTAITVSPRGNVWVKHGEVNTVSLLDGYTVKQLPAPGDRLTRVYQSRAGRIWSLGTAGLLEFSADAWAVYPWTNTLTLAKFNQLQSGRPPPILPADGDRVLVLFPQRLLAYQANQREFVELRTLAQSRLGRFEDLASESGGGVWITGARGVARYDGLLRQLSPESPWTEHLVPASLGVTNLTRPAEDDDGGLTTVAEATSAGRRVAVHFDGHDWRAIELAGQNLRFAWRGRATNQFWGMTSTALFQLEDGRAEKVPLPYSISQFFDVAVQPRSGFWLATREGVLRHATSTWQPVTTASVPAAPVAALILDAEGALHAATEAGLASRGDQGWQSHPWPPSFEPVFSSGDGLASLADGRLLVNTGGALWSFTPATGGFQRLSHPEPGRWLRRLGQLDTDRHVVISRPSSGGTGDVRWELFDGRQFAPWLDGPPPPAFGGDWFFLRQAANGDWWLGGSGGVAWFRDDRWQLFTNADGYTDDGALVWMETDNARIWCAGLGRLLEFDGKRWTLLREGLDHANAMLRGDDGSVWIASGNGLHRFHKGVWVTQETTEGLPSVTVLAVAQDRSGRIWAGTSRGLTEYHPRNDIDPPKTLAIEWEQQSTRGGSAAGELRFTGRDKWQFTPDGRLLYSYRVDERDWSAFSAAEQVRVPALSPGRHRVEVRALDRNWNQETSVTALEFRVSLPWFQDHRVVGVGLAGLILALAAAGVAVNRHWKLRRSYTDVERQVEARSQELKRAYAALAHSQKMTALGTLAAGIAHDFNNLLSIIKGSAQIIGEHPEDRAKVQTRVSRILGMVDQASDIVRAMLGFGQAADRSQMPCDLNELVDATLSLLSDRFQRDVQLERDLAPALPTVSTAPALMQQMLLNLVLNAADAMAGRGVVTLSTRRLDELPAGLVLAPRAAPGHVAVTVRDRGTGIPPEHLPRIFEPFFTTKALTDRPGRGLGLYMVYEFAQEMGHGLSVQTEPGKGSTFTIILPWADAVGSDEREHAPAAETDNGS